MPRFLDTHTGQFVWIGDPSNKQYAVLSHLWRSAAEVGLPEQTYDDIRRIQVAAAGARDKKSSVWSTRLAHLGAKPQTLAEQTSAATSILSHPDLSHKIKEICRVVRDAGYKLLWIDACCIDSKSSLELTEAVNATYALFSRAQVCYVYLMDVPDGDDPTIGPESAFWRSKWHQRAWTLQELIAPAHVEFLSNTWTPLGTKIKLASVLEKITGVDEAVLTGRASVDSVSVARRMWWASRRRARRVEDEAYSLMTIFGVHMQPIYGEGCYAFIRLQEEIIRTIPDQSIFAWGPSCHLRSLDTDGHPLENLEVRNGADFEAHEQGLLAKSPRDFAHAGDVVAMTAEDFATRLAGTSLSGSSLPDRLSPPAYVFTPDGVSVDLPCVDISGLAEALHYVRYQGNTHSDGRPGAVDDKRAHTLALLRCHDKDGRLISLPLFRLPEKDQGLVVGTGPVARNVLIPPARARGDPWRTVRLDADVLDAARGYFLDTHSLLIHRHYLPSIHATGTDVTDTLMQRVEALEREVRTLREASRLGGTAIESTGTKAWRSLFMHHIIRRLAVLSSKLP
ncbi:hypothetical protein C8Q79DRAFT_1006161 [Trametes meyenii]|nr:hypothetical protein C8Q79DRAFT_1006161 [Trametes meyenii]